jgi:CubicO group peptidase (beta-lactamase class C family)
MRSRKVGLIGCLLAVGSLAMAAGGDDPKPSAPDFSPLKEALRKTVEEAPLDGACLLVLRDGEPIVDACFGAYSGTTVVAIASASKWLSAAAIMTLVDEGKLSLDDPVSKHLPNFTGEPGRITVRQLLSHTSGLPSQAPSIRNARITLEEAADQIARLELVARPGAEFRYGGVSMQVAGRVAEVVSGKTWAELFDERIARPCAMKNTRYGRGVNLNPSIAGGASSTRDDYRNFLTMILNKGTFQGRRVLSEASIREMEHDQTRGAASKVATAVRLREGTKYGLGEWLDLMDQSGQGIEISSPGAFGFRPWVDRERGVIGVFVVEIRNPRLKRSLASVGPVQKAVGAVLDRAARP